MTPSETWLCILSLAQGEGLMHRMNWESETTSAAASCNLRRRGPRPDTRIPDWAGAALLGGSLMVATGVLSIEEAYSSGRFQYSENAGSTKYPLAVTELAWGHT